MSYDPYAHGHANKLWAGLVWFGLVLDFGFATGFDLGLTMGLA